MKHALRHALRLALALLVALLLPTAVQAQTSGGDWIEYRPFFAGTLPSGQLLLPNGSGGAPSYSFTNDPDTGMYLGPTVGILSFSIDGTARWQMTDSAWRPGSDGVYDLGETSKRVKRAFFGSNDALTGSSAPFIQGSQTWDNASTTFTASFLNVTDTNSAAASRLAAWQVGAVDQFYVTKAGNLFARGDVDVGGASIAPLNTGVTDLGESSNRFRAALLGGGTITSSTPAINMSQTFNSGGTSFNAAFWNITNTASAAGSRFVTYRISNTEVAGVDLSGNINTAGTVTSSKTTDFGWSVQAAANQACNTTCTSACVFGWDTAAGEVAVACTDATADKCLCAGGS